MSRTHLNNSRSFNLLNGNEVSSEVILSENEQLTQRVSLFLASQNRPVLTRLNVFAASDVVTLQGASPTFFERQLALAVTRRVAGVRQVVDEIEVAEVSVSRQPTFAFEQFSSSTGFALIP